MKPLTARCCWTATLAAWLLVVGCHNKQDKSTAALPEAASKEIKLHHHAAVTFVEYVSTPNDVVDRMLVLAEITSDDLLYDLGCGDGRILVEAAKTYGCHAKGCDLDPLRIDESRENATKNGVENLVTVTLEDLGKMDLSEATVVTLYLSPQVNTELLPHFRQLKPGVRIVSHNFPIPGIHHEKRVRMVSEEDKAEHHIYLYRCPLEEAAATG